MNQEMIKIFEYHKNKNKNKPFSQQQKEFNEALSKAEKGNLDAMRDVSEMYKAGYDVESSIIQSEMWRQNWRAEYSKMTGQQYSPCFITTAVCEYFGKSDDCKELTTLRNYRDKWLKNQPDGQKLIDEYYKIAPSIVIEMKNSDNYSEICEELLTKYINPCIELINQKKFDECKNLYIEMVNYAKSITDKKIIAAQEQIKMKEVTIQVKYVDGGAKPVTKTYNGIKQI